MTKIQKQTICVVTGSRADYGLLYWLMKEIQNDEDLCLQIIATGMHLSPEFGLTYQEIESDGFRIDEKVEIQLSSDTVIGVTTSVGLAVIGIGGALSRLKPDMVVILGDRYEILAAAQAALLAKVPIAHLHGGETTEGAFDEAIRHSITKMSLLHFVAAEPYRSRVIQLGEAPSRVFNFGAPGLDHIQKTKLLSRMAFEEEIEFSLGELCFLVTYHPVTLQSSTPEQTFQNLLDAFDEFPSATIIFTGQNSDPQGRIIGSKIESYIEKHHSRCCYFSSLGHVRYLSALQHVDAVIGNSSSGLSEVPIFKKPTVNIGDRQKGRIRASSVIDCAEDKQSIQEGITKALSADFQKSLQTVLSPYGVGDVSPKIKEVLKNYDLSERYLMKQFHDIKIV
jgi:UDP-hydrolysing UDP-N-acetyl-D-glucosamine 2-epimerase